MNISGATKVFQWSRWLLGFLGIWPLDLNNGHFIFCVTYLSIGCFLQYADLIENISDLSHVVVNLTETIVFSMIALKIAIYRISTRQLRELIRNVQKDFSKELYSTDHELKIFLEYNSLAKTIVHWCSLLSVSTAVLFYIQPLASHLLAYNDSTGNSSSVFALPYYIRLFFNMTEARTYYIIYACEIFFAPISTSGYIGPNSLLVIVVLHICGQLSILASQVENMIQDPKTVHQQLKHIVIKHCRLISLFENLQSVYSAFLLQELLGITLLTCLGCYNVLAASVFGDVTNFLRVLVYNLSIISQLLGFCYIGECLITESTSLYNAFCNCEWYNVPPHHAKLFVMCLLRSQQPFALTAGKFFTFSLENFTSVMKTSMAYMSVLRNFI